MRFGLFLSMWSVGWFLLLTGCDYIDHKVYEVETKQGGAIKFSCPLIDRERSELSYIYDGDCVLVR